MDKPKHIRLTAGGVDQKLTVDELTYTKIMIAKTTGNIYDILLNFGNESIKVDIDDLHIIQ